MNSLIHWLRRRITSLNPTVASQTESSQRPLVLFANVGPTQILLAECIQAAWSDECAVVWLEEISNSPTDELRRIASGLKPTCAIAVGLQSVYAIRDALPELSVEGMFLHHELDFRFSNNHRQQRLLEAFDSCERLWFDSTVAMEKAAAHGSNRPHVLVPLPSFPSYDPGRPSTANVAILLSQEELTDSEQITTGALESAISEAGGNVSVHTVDQLYTSADLVAGRSWEDAIARKIPYPLSCIVLVGKSGHHLFTATGLRTNSVTVFVEATIENAAIAHRLRLESHYIARGVALVERVKDEVQKFDPKAAACKPSGKIDSFRPNFESKVARDLPTWHEEGILDADFSHFDLFFSVAAIENRSNGARPQRIRAMSQAFEDQGVPLVRVTANQKLLRRRMSGALDLTRTGAQPRFAYGENSTAPMSNEARGLLVSGLKELRGAGLRFGWYVRDLHWLDPASTVSQTRSDIDQLQRESLAEFTAMSEIADVLFAPSDQSSQWFNRLLHGHIEHLPHRWVPLPPGIDSANCVASSPTLSSVDPEQLEACQIVYAGGLGGVYDLQNTMTALTGLSGPWNLQMLVRPEEQEIVHRLTSSEIEQQVEINNGEFVEMPLTNSPAVGLALLDSDYGRASFPLKVMSYLERRMPVVVYRDSSPAALISKYGAGSVVENTAESIKAGIGAAVTTTDSVDWPSVHLNESWCIRAKTVRNALETSPRL